MIELLTKKVLLCIGEMESGYSNRGDRGSYGSMGRYSKEGGYSRRYSRDNGREEYLEQLRDIMESAPDGKTRKSINRMIREIE